jgi:hypothetical protein
MMSKMPQFLDKESLLNKKNKLSKKLIKFITRLI